MLISPEINATTRTITHKRQLVAWYEAGSLDTTAAPQIRAGCQFILVKRDGNQPVSFADDDGLAVFLQEMQTFRWRLINPPPTNRSEDDTSQPVAAKRGRSLTSLGGGGQLSLLTDLHNNVHTLATELYYRFDEIGSICRVLNLFPLSTGLYPLRVEATIGENPVPVYPLMLRQAHERKEKILLDRFVLGAGQSFCCSYSSEDDMIDKMRIALSVQPVLAAVLSCSALKDGQHAGALSVRGLATKEKKELLEQLHTVIFGSGFGFAAYIDWIMEHPLFFVRDGMRCIDVAPLYWADWMNHPPSQSTTEETEAKSEPVAKAKQSTSTSEPAKEVGKSLHQKLENTLPTLQNWTDHLSTVFAPVRLGRMIEIESGDMGNPELVIAQAAFWKGLLLDARSREKALDIVAQYSCENWLQLCLDAPEKGMDMQGNNQKTARDIMDSFIQIARDALKRAAIRSEDGTCSDESQYLAPLEMLVSLGLTQSEDTLRRFCDEWGGDATHAIKYFCLR